MSGNNATWWSTQVQNAGSHFFEPTDASKKGKFGGMCFHITCARSGANWYNKINLRYYCEVCAKAVNETCLKQGQTEVCTIHL